MKDDPTPAPRVLAQPQPQQQASPHLNVQIMPDGKTVLFQAILGPGLALTQAIDEDVMNQICAAWIESQRQHKKSQALVETIKRHPRRNN